MEVSDIIQAIFVVLILLIIVVGFFILIPIVIYDELYINPEAADKANGYCKSMGFDFYESYRRVGILSKDPVAIKCGYASDNRQIDLNIGDGK